MQWGQKVDSPFVRKPDPAKPGWRDDPDRPGIERYWSGTGWDDTIAPRAKPDPSWKQARVVVLGILIAAAIIFMIWRANQPSTFDCLEQATDVATGQRFAVDDACR